MESAAAQLSVQPPPIESFAEDPGRVGDPASWRTPEFLRDNGMISIGAEYAYAAGYAGAGMNIGVVDSGVFAGHIREHGSRDTNYAIGDRYFSVEAQGGETGPTSGFYNQAYNDSHGTHVSGTIGASRDGAGETTPTGPVANMHGVAFNVDLYMGNTAKTDGVFYGVLPATATLAQTPDNAYLANVYRAVKAAPTANGKPIRLITSSWGSQPNTENYNTYDTPAGAPATFGLNASWRHLATPDGVADVNGKIVHWLNGAIEVARTGTIIQFTAGNGGYANPTPRGAAPYFLLELEGRWYTTSGINPATGRTFNADGSVLVPGQQTFNQCGVAKWSCVTAPANGINSTTVQVVDGVPQPRYGGASGTSMAGPHSAAALTLIMQRFPYMTNEQALYTMFTTGRQNNTTGTPAVPNPGRGGMVQVPDARNGWHTVYDGSLVKRGEGTLFLAGENTWQGATTVNAGKLSVTGSHASAITVAGGTLGGNGSIGSGVTVNGGVLAPGLSAEEAAKITDVPAQAGNVLSVGGDVRFAGGRFAVTAKRATDYSKLRADGDLVLSGPLLLDVQASLTPGTALTVAKGRSLQGTFDGLPQGSFVRAGGNVFLVSYLDNSVTLIAAATNDGTVGGTVPATLALALGNAASFGPFMPGVAREYTATTAATVVSTAADATLAVADPSPAATGHLVNGAFSLPQPLQVGGGGPFAPVGGAASPTTLKTWAGPTSNEAVALTFKQAIGASDALRTGVYSKTLTFTLSTTAP